MGYIVGVRADERALCWSDNHCVPLDLCPRPRHLVTILPDHEASSSGPVASSSARPLALGPGSVDTSVQHPALAPVARVGSCDDGKTIAVSEYGSATFGVYVKNLAPNLPVASIQKDFAADRVVVKSAISAIMYDTSKHDAEKALDWHSTAHKGRVLAIMWSNQ